jgi:hypothetical protein
MGRESPEKNGVRLLGSPIGSPEFKAHWIRTRIDTKLVPLLKQIEGFSHPQICLHLVRRALHQSGMVHAVRTTDPRAILAELERIDELVLEALAKSVFHSSLTPIQKKLIQLPVSFGGWGFTSFKLIGLTGYASSLSTCLPQILSLRPDSESRLKASLDSVVELLKKTYFPSSVPFEAKAPYVQKHLCLTVHAVEWKKLMEMGEVIADPALSAVIRAQAEDKAGLWKISPATKANILSGKDFLFVARRSLRLPVFPSDRCVGSILFGKYGDEALSDKAGGGVTRRHNRIRDFLHQVGSDGNVEQACEKTIPLINTPHRDSYRADLFYHSGPNQHRTAVDVTVTNELGSSILSYSARSGSTAAEHGEKSKINLLQASLKSHDIDFIPVSFGSFGGHGAQCPTLFNFLIRRLSLQKSIPYAEAAGTFWTALSLLVQAQNADALARLEMNSLPVAATGLNSQAS